MQEAVNLNLLNNKTEDSESWLCFLRPGQHTCGLNPYRAQMLLTGSLALELFFIYRDEVAIRQNPTAFHQSFRKSTFRFHRNGGGVQQSGQSHSKMEEEPKSKDGNNWGVAFLRPIHGAEEGSISCSVTVLPFLAGVLDVVT